MGGIAALSPSRWREPRTMSSASLAAHMRSTADSQLSTLLYMGLPQSFFLGRAAIAQNRSMKKFVTRPYSESTPASSPHFLGAANFRLHLEVRTSFIS